MRAHTSAILAACSLRPQRKAGMFLCDLAWIPETNTAACLPPACGYKVPSQSAKGLTIVNLLKEAGGPQHYYFYYCLSSPPVSANCSPVEFGRSPEFDWLCFYSPGILFCVHLLNVFFLMASVKKLFECSVEFEKHMSHGLSFFTRTTSAQCLYLLSFRHYLKASTRGRPVSTLNLHRSTFWCIFIYM